MTVEPEWVTPDPDPGAIERLAESLDCSSVLASVLVNRGITEPREADRVLDPTTDAIHPPDDLPDIDSAVDELEAAVEDDCVIGLFSDRDVDGITGATILSTLLEELDADPLTRVPGKYDGYGLDEDSVTAFSEQGVDLLVAVDCGTTAHDAIERAAAEGITVVVVDHHDPDDALPPVAACVNPRRGDSEYPNSDLAAGALAWKVGQALVERAFPLEIDRYHRNALPLAVVATLGDYMPLTIENRAIVREGFARLDESDLPGLVETADHCGVSSMRDIGWSLVPLLNAGQEAESGELMLQLLRAQDTDEIDDLLDRFESFREERREQRAERLAHLEECIDTQIDPETADVLFVETDRYVGGGAMSEVSSRWHRPIVTYRANDSGYKGGGRSTPDVDLLELYGSCEDLLESYWGHPGAAGFRVDRENLEPFRDRLIATLRERYDVAELRPTLDFDAIVEPSELDTSTAQELQQLGPFGTDNDEPLVLLEGVDIVEWEWFGDDDSHWKGHPEGTADFSVVDWNADTIDVSADEPPTCDIAGTLSVNNWDGTVTVNLEAVRFGTGSET